VTCGDCIGDYRVVYSVDDSLKVIDVIVIRPRRGAYR
jgi:mRNA-degrading endonuclease RelE of RelBE toxin-antitoxin system